MHQGIWQKILFLQECQDDNSTICYWVSKPLSIFIKLAEGDNEKVGMVKKIIEKNFDLSPRGIREMLKLNNPIYEVTSAYGHFGRKPTNKRNFLREKTDKTNLFKL